MPEPFGVRALEYGPLPGSGQRRSCGVREQGHRGARIELRSAAPILTSFSTCVSGWRPPFPSLESNLRSSPGPRSETNNRGARIRTGDLCDPNAALYRTEPHPGLLGYLQSGRGGIRTHADNVHTISNRAP